MTDYMISNGQMQALREITHRLYNEKPLIGDERRDLAIRMDAIINTAEETDPDEDKPCDYCNGVGLAGPGDPCHKCDGTGRIDND